MICEALSDRMPAVARGTAAWDAEESAHFAGCAECQAEFALIAPIARSATTAASVNVERITAGVLRQTAAGTPVVALASRRRNWSRGLIGLAAAAGIVLMVYLARPVAPEAGVAVVPTRMKTAIPELDALLEDELRVVLAAVEEETTQELVPGPLPRLGDLTETELQQLLQSVEG
jgi:hypothetical protein